MINSAEYWEVAKVLRDQYELFYTCWNLGRPQIDNTIPTACVAFDSGSGGFLAYKFNENFYNELTPYERAFVVAHESLHVIHNHGIRFKGKIPQIANIAADLVVNHSLITKYGFERELLTHDILKNACWFDTIFSNEVLSDKTFSKNKSFEFYYELLIQESHKSSQGGGQIIDSHESLDSATINSILKKIAETSGSDLSDMEKKLLNQLKEDFSTTGVESEKAIAGVDTGTINRILNATYNPKYLWAKIIKSMRSAFRNRENEQDSWLTKERRHSLLSNSLILPCKAIKNNKNKLELAIFMDVSGSCIDMVDRFYALINTVPLDIFDVKAHAFDTSVRQIRLNHDKITAGGGTSFVVIEEYIRKNFDKYPYAVLVVTDGEATEPVRPKHPERWKWVLKGNYKSCIPNESTTFNIEDFK